MATDITNRLIFEQSRKRQRLTHLPNLLPNQQVEVLSLEEGFQGSWHSGTVIESRTRIRVVKYDHILCDDASNNLTESIPFAIDGNISSDFANYRCKIRPVPPKFILDKNCLHYGQCVDVFYKDAWWEGVVFDHFDGSNERIVFFPDMGDELRTPFKDLRLTQDWDARSDEWKLRRDWIFLEVIEELKQEWPLLVSVKQIWYEVRMTTLFVKSMKEWTCIVKERWKETVKGVILENFKLTMVEFVDRLNFSEDLHEGCSFLDIKKRILDSFEEEFAYLRSNPDLNLVIKSDYKNLGSPSVDPVSEWSKSVDYFLIGSEIFPETECCPDAIFKYYEYFKLGEKPPVFVTLKVRQHLSYLGWKIESRVCRIGAKGGVSFRYRYTDPNGKLYYSLNVLCTDLNNRSSDVYRYLETPISSTPTKEEPNSHVNDVIESEFCPQAEGPNSHVNNVIESEFCPQAVVDYFSLTSEANSDLRKTKDVKKLQTSAAKHLFAVGWSKFYSERISGRKVLVYGSPNGRKFYALREACSYYIKEFLIKKKDESLTKSTKEMLKKDESLTKSRNGSTCDSLRTTHLLRSTKRARKEISPMYQTPRTILSWLIDHNVVLPRSKVQYRCKKDGRIMREGRVTRDGIKCSCCKRIFSLSKFQFHGGSSYGQSSANVFLEDGRSLLDCQRELQQNLDQGSRSIRMKPLRIKGIKGKRHEIENDNDYICSICQYGGELVLCDECPSAFHMSCLGLKEVPDGKWFCPSCCCRICNQNRFSENYEQNMDSNILNCEQCERRYHIGCLKRKEAFLKPKANWFCSLRCEEIFLGLQRLLGKSIPVGRDNLTWTLLKHNKLEFSDYDASNMEELTESYSKLNVAISVMHECFEPVKEPRNGRDITEDVILCRWSELRRLNFKGFYTVLLEKDDELISTAVVRVYGEKVAELPLVGTRFQYRRRGMCHILMHELEKKLKELGVERLVLPAVSSVLHTWTRSFGFSLMTESDKLKFLGYTFLDFQGTRMCHKLLLTNLLSTEPTISRGNSCGNIVDLDKESSNHREGNNNGFLKCYQRRKFRPTRVEESFHK